MSSDDTSDKLLSGDSGATTSPTITTILERINVMEERLMAHVNSTIADFRRSVESKLDDTNKSFIA